MPYQIEVGAKTDKRLGEMDSVVGASLERKIKWLGENAANIIHRRLVGMPKDLIGLCKLRLGDYRILYWVEHEKRRIFIYRIEHRSEVYRDF